MIEIEVFIYLLFGAVWFFASLSIIHAYDLYGELQEGILAVVGLGTVVWPLAFLLTVIIVPCWSIKSHQ